MIERGLAWTAVVAAALPGVCPAQPPFASRVLVYDPSPGQNVNSAQFGDPLRALGPPIGGGVAAADNTKLVTLGGFGGSITLGFDAPVPNLPPTAGNPRGADLIVFGNAFWAGGDPMRRWAEPGVIEVSADTNGNGLPDDAWFVIRGSHLPDQPVDALGTHVFDSGNTPPPWFPVQQGGGPLLRTALLLSDPLFSGSSPVLVNDSGDQQRVRGYADCAPTLALGDFDGDGEVDDDQADPDWFYTIPSDPISLTIPHFCGGGEAVRIEDAVDHLGVPAGLLVVDFVRITTAVQVVRGLFGEASTEVAAVAAVRPRSRADVGGQGGRLGPDGSLDNNDFIVFIDLFFSQRALADLGVQGGGAGSDGVLDNNDFVSFISHFFAGV